MCYSCETIDHKSLGLYQGQYVISIIPEWFHPDYLTLKKRASITLLQNLEPNVGLSNDKRLICLDFMKKFLVDNLNNKRIYFNDIKETDKDARIPF